MLALVDFINRLPLAGLMLVTALGYTLGRFQCRKISLGPAGGALFVALPLGFAGISMDHLYGGEHPELTIGALGFVLFIYSVGFEAGPRFFASFRTRHGWRYIAVGVAVNVFAVLAALVLGKAFKLDAATVAGVLSGALTSAPTYAAASQIVADEAALSVAFALTYPFGLAGLVLIIQTLPRWFHQDLAQEAKKHGDTASQDGQTISREVTRGFVVERDDIVAKPLRELHLTRDTGCLITLVVHDQQPRIPHADTTLSLGDHLLATGRIDELRSFEKRIGSEIDAEDLWRNRPPPGRIQVRNRELCGKALAELRLTHQFHGVIARIQRGDEWVEPGAEVSLELNDIVEVAGSKTDLSHAAKLLGRFEPAVDQANIAIYTGGILIGLLIGAIHFGPLGLDFKIGSAAGLLIAGVLLGWLGRIGPYPTHVPRPARQFVRDLGILLFIGETGLAAGAELSQGMTLAPALPLLGACAIMTVTVLASLTFALKALKLGPLDAWGSVCGGMTSSAALHTLRRTADANEVTISYAAAYAVASVIATIAGQVIVLMM